MDFIECSLDAKRFWSIFGWISVPLVLFFVFGHPSFCSGKAFNAKLLQNKGHRSFDLLKVLSSRVWVLATFGQIGLHLDWLGCSLPLSIKLKTLCRCSAQTCFINSGKFRGIRKDARAFMRTLAKYGELWRTHNVIFRISSLTFTRVPAKVTHVHQSSGEGAFCMRVAFGTYPINGNFWSKLAVNFVLVSRCVLICCPRCPLVAVLGRARGFAEGFPFTGSTWRSWFCVSVCVFGCDGMDSVACVYECSRTCVSVSACVCVCVRRRFCAWHACVHSYKMPTSTSGWQLRHIE